MSDVSCHEEGLDFYQVQLISPLARVSCDVTILRDDSISFRPCSKAVLIPLIDSLVDMSSSSLNAEVDPKILLAKRY